jgi:hypothetical protein
MKKSKAQAVRKYITNNPNATLRGVCAATGASYAYVCTIKGKMKKENWKHLTTVSSNTSINTVMDTATDTTPERMEELVFKATQGRDRTAAPKALEGIDATLAERGSKYGKFVDHATLTQKLKRVLHEHAVRHDKSFTFDQAEALDMICHKLGRIVNGDPDYADSWVDIAGYAKLVADRLESGKEV